MGKTAATEQLSPRSRPGFVYDEYSNYGCKHGHVVTLHNEPFLWERIHASPEWRGARITEAGQNRGDAAAYMSSLRGLLLKVGNNLSNSIFSNMTHFLTWTSTNDQQREFPQSDVSIKKRFTHNATGSKVVHIYIYVNRICGEKPDGTIIFIWRNVVTVMFGSEGAVMLF